MNGTVVHQNELEKCFRTQNDGDGNSGLFAMQHALIVPRNFSRENENGSQNASQIGNRMNCLQDDEKYNECVFWSVWSKNPNE